VTALIDAIRLTVWTESGSGRWLFARRQNFVFVQDDDVV
jgi:hypothetical protein